MMDLGPHTVYAGKCRLKRWCGKEFFIHQIIPSLLKRKELKMFLTVTPTRKNQRLQTHELHVVLNIYGLASGIVFQFNNIVG